MSRIGLRMLAGHFLALHDQMTHPVQDFVGLICTRTSPAQVISSLFFLAPFSFLFFSFLSSIYFFIKM